MTRPDKSEKELIEVRHESTATNCAKLARDLRAMTWLYLYTVQIDFCKEKKGVEQHELQAT